MVEIRSKSSRSQQEIFTMSDDLLDFALILEVEQLQEYNKWTKEIPFIPFKKDWEVKPVPPHGGAIVRFLVRRNDIPEKSISVYLDCYDRMGCVGKPYWEIYPYGEDTYRCGMAEVEDLVAAIDKEFGNKRFILTKS